LVGLEVLENIDELFEREELSAAPDAGWPDCFNSGVFVFCPSLDTYRRLLQFAVTHGSFDGTSGPAYLPQTSGTGSRRPGDPVTQFRVCGLPTAASPAS